LTTIIDSDTIHLNRILGSGIPLNTITNICYEIGLDEKVKRSLADMHLPWKGKYCPLGFCFTGK